jgi:cytochrome c peroxidase
MGSRNTPSLTNVGYFHRQLFWDGRADNLEEQALHPVGTPEEMGGSWPEVISYVEGKSAYVSAFQEAFRTTDIDSVQVGRALAQFQRNLVSASSKYDRVKRGEATFTEREEIGHAIFFDLADDAGGPFAGLPKGECAHCHTPPHFSNLGFANNGLDEQTDLADFVDKGRGGITGQVYDNGLFRTPGLRNVERTAPYMHDGRFATLEEVVEHYNRGGHYAENRSANIRRLGMNESEKAALVAFLLTLTDESFVNREWHNPQ